MNRLLLRRWLLLLATLTGFATGATGCVSTAFAPDPSHGFLARQVMTQQGLHKFWIYRPNHVAANEKLPVILYLHGGGERGDDGLAQTQVGLGPAVQQTLGYFPFIVVFPQCAKGNFWALPDMAERAVQAVDQAIRDFHGDPDRVYVTGNSMGGFGTWFLAARYPGRFAALAPICGGVRPPSWVPIPKAARLIDLDGDPYQSMAQKIGPTPTWIFHGADDWLIPPRESTRMYEALKKIGGEVRHTEWPGVGHAAEVPTYADPALFEWFLQHRRSPAAAK
jgi:predicted peptidase